MYLVFEFVLISSLILILLKIIFLLISIKLKFNREKYSVFECGMDLMNNPRLPFSLNFYFVSIIFLIFDVELMMITPLMFCFKLTSLDNSMLMINLLFLILMVGLIYEWWNGMLNWTI